MTHPYPPKQADERETLEAFLDYYRAVLRHKASGLTDKQLHTAIHPSSLTLGALLHHMAVVEHWWFHQAFLGLDAQEPWASAPWKEDGDWEMTVAPHTPTEIIFQRYDTAVERSREILADVESLDELSVRERKGEKWSMRWILVHMIEELARHAGHADFLREALDGQTGDFD